MRYKFGHLAALVVLSMHTAGSSSVAQQGLPLRNGRPVVATVNGDPIFLDDLAREAAPSANRTRLRQGLGTSDEKVLLDRLVNIKLVVQEAHRMGLDEAPEIRKQVEVTSRQILRDVLTERLLKGIKADAAAVEKLYRESVRELKTSGLLFSDPAAAGRAQQELAGGAAFREVAARAVAARAAKSDSNDAYHSKRDFLPPVAEALGKLRIGQITPVIKIEAGFVVVKVLDIRYPENPVARAEVRKKVESQQRDAALRSHEETLRGQYAIVNAVVLKSIDYAAPKPGVDEMLKDKRVVVEIKGAQSVTVADLTDYLRLQAFHGTDQVEQRRRMNTQKEIAIDAMVTRRLLNLEAQRLGLDRTDAYRDRVKGYRESLVFGAFVEKVIAPGNKLKEEEAKAYYKSHLKDYSYPEMAKIRGLAFTRRDSAEWAMRKLKEGTDYGWLAANAPGQVGKGAPGLLALDGQPVLTASMPAGLQKAIAGGRPNDARLYASPEGFVYVVVIQQMIPSNAKPYEEVREDIGKKVYGEKLNKSMQEYAGKLRARSKVEIHLKKV